MKISLVFVMALAAGWPAAAQSTTPAQPPAAPAAPVAPVAGQVAPLPGQVPGAAAPAPAPSVPASRKFTSDAGIMFSAIKPDKTADFEAVLARVKDALSRSADPQRKQQALSWRVFKGIETGPGGAVIYVWLIDPPVKDVEYVITDILREAFPTEAQDLWAKYTACFLSGQTMLNLQQVLNMSPAIVPK